jgi:hypothetical protein
LPCPAPRGRRDSPQPEPDRTTPCGRLRGRTTRRAVDQAASRAGSHDHDATGRRLRPERRACALQKKVRWIRYPCKLDGSGFVTAVCAFGKLRPLGHDVLLCSWSCGHRRLSASQADVGSGRLSNCRAGDDNGWPGQGGPGSRSSRCTAARRRRRPRQRQIKSIGQRWGLCCCARTCGLALGRALWASTARHLVGLTSCFAFWPTGSNNRRAAICWPTQLH